VGPVGLPDHRGGAGFGVWNSFIKLGLPVLALVLLQGGAGGGRVIAALLGIAGLVGATVVFVLMLRSEEAAWRFGVLAAGSPLGRCGYSGVCRLPAGSLPPSSSAPAPSTRSSTAGDGSR
jgi:hypothetical protein